MENYQIKKDKNQIQENNSNLKSDIENIKIYYLLFLKILI